MTDSEYFDKKQKVCRQFTACNTKCPLFRYQTEKGVHACGTLCDVLEAVDLDKAKEVLSSYSL